MAMIILIMMLAIKIWNNENYYFVNMYVLNIWVKKKNKQNYFLLENRTVFNTLKYNAVAEPLVIGIMAICLLIAHVMLLGLFIARFK